QKSRRSISVSQPSHRFTVARGGEVEQTKPLEERRIVHCRVKRGDELFGGVEFGISDSRVFAERLLTRALRGALENFQQPSDAEQRERKSGREQRIDDAGG